MTRQLLIIFAAALGVIGTRHAAADVVTTLAGNGDDVVVRRGSATENDAFVRLKNQSGILENNINDRVALLKFDLTLLSPGITAATVRLQMPRGASNSFPLNTFDAGETLFLYGVPDLAAGEIFNPGTVTFANFPYTTGTTSGSGTRPVADTTGNNVNDTLLPLLGTYTFAAVSNAGVIVDFSGTPLVSFLTADTNGIATFALTVSMSNATKTPVFNSDTATTLVNGLPPILPSLLTNADAAAVPESSRALPSLICGAAAIYAWRQRTRWARLSDVSKLTEGRPPIR
jgi:hypothetical protein